MTNIVEFRLTNEPNEGYNQNIGFCKYCRRYAPKSYFIGCYVKECKTCVRCREKHLTARIYMGKLLNIYQNKMSIQKVAENANSMLQGLIWTVGRV